MSGKEENPGLMENNVRDGNDDDAVETIAGKDEAQSDPPTRHPILLPVKRALAPFRMVWPRKLAVLRLILALVKTTACISNPVTAEIH